MSAERPVRIERLRFAPGRRILVVSDIHGNLPYLRGLLDKAGFHDGDELIIDGDFLEKGKQSLDTLRFLMELCRRGNCHVVLGNCDAWSELFTMPPSAHAQVLDYVRRRRSGLLWELCLALGIDPLALDDFSACLERLREAFPAEWDFLDTRPHAIETEHYLFAHAGARPDKPLDAHTREELLHCDAFLRRGWRFARWVIVGHWPVMLYGENIVSAAPVIDRDKRIVSIDGGCVLKDDGQLNALVIPEDGSEDFDWIAYDPFPVRTVKTAQAASARSYYIRWGDNRVRVLERGGEFSRCRHIRTGYEMDILTKYLYGSGEECACNDCTDYVLPLAPGDRVSVVEETSRGCFVKHRGVSGWYAGEWE